MPPDRFDDQRRDLLSLFFAQRWCLPSHVEDRSRSSPLPDRFDQSQRARKPDETQAVRVESRRQFPNFSGWRSDLAATAAPHAPTNPPPLSSDPPAIPNPASATPLQKKPNPPSRTQRLLSGLLMESARVDSRKMGSEACSLKSLSGGGIQIRGRSERQESAESSGPEGFQGRPTTPDGDSLNREPENAARHRRTAFDTAKKAVETKKKPAIVYYTIAGQFVYPTVRAD